MKWLLAPGLLLGLASLPCQAQAPPSSPERLKILCWNVLYGFDHGRAVEAGAEWVRAQEADVLALQELNGFTAESLARTARSYGHPFAVLQKESGFSMGLTSTAPIDVVERRVEGFHHGFLHGRTHGIDFFVVHFWPGKEHEVEHVREKARALVQGGASVVILGDFNSHSERDATYLEGRAVEPRFANLRGVEEAGFVDVVQRFDRAAEYSCPSPITIPKWSKDQAELESKRQRIDFILVDSGLARSVRFATIPRSAVLDRISDHYPVVAELAWPARDPSAPPPRFAFGLIADCQYCAGPTRGVRRYAESPRKLRACVEHLDTLDLTHVVSLGDFIDRDFASFDVVAPIFGSLACDAYHVLGNHDYSVADEHKPALPTRLGMPARYHDFAARDWRFVVLDGNDVSLHAHPAGSPEHAAALAYKEQHAPEAPDWNGAIGPDQLAWLEGVLERADRAGEKVALHCHFPVFPSDVHNLWNATEVLDLIRPHSSVKVWLNGHNHAGNYAQQDGIHYLTLKGMVDTVFTSYAVVEVHADHLAALGFGREQDRILPLR